MKLGARHAISSAPHDGRFFKCSVGTVPIFQPKGMVNLLPEILSEGAYCAGDWPKTEMGMTPQDSATRYEPQRHDDTTE